MKETYCGIRRFAIRPRSGHLKSIQHNRESTMKGEKKTSGWEQHNISGIRSVRVFKITTVNSIHVGRKPIL